MDNLKQLDVKPKSEFLLGAGLDGLHRESREWLNTIAFWKYETRFFGDLLKKKEETFGDLSGYGKILEDLDNVHADLFDYLADDILKHEILLSRLLKKDKGTADVKYRERHRKLKSRMDICERDIRVFKRMVFGYVKPL